MGLEHMASDVIKYCLHNLSYHLWAWSFDSLLAGKNTEYWIPCFHGKPKFCLLDLALHYWWLCTHDTLYNETLIGESVSSALGVAMESR